MNPQQKLTFAQRPDTEKVFGTGDSHNGAFTAGGPVVIPRLVRSNRNSSSSPTISRTWTTAPRATRPRPPSRRTRNTSTATSPICCGWPIPAQYQIYDPLTVRPDPARPGSFIRDPFPNNIIPRDRFMNANGTYKNPLFALYRDMMPAPNQNFIESGQIPNQNYYQGATPNLTGAKNFGIRLDYNLSANNRFFFRYAGTGLHEQLGDWTYETKYKGLHTNDKTRSSWAYTGSWTRVMGNTVADMQVSTNRFFEDQQRREAHNYKPSDVGLPTYLDEFCTAASNCMLPVIQVAGYQTVGLEANGGLQSTNAQGQGSVTTIMASHTLRGGVDLRLARYENNLIPAGNVSSTYMFDPSYTRAADTTAVFPTNNIGPSLAALMLGIPTQATIGQSAPVRTSNPYYGAYFQDSWRVTDNLTISPGFRFEYQDGITEAEDRLITGFDPNATLAITQGAEAAYARSPIPQVPINQFSVKGGAVYATAPDASRTWQGQALFMPRVSAGYKLDDKTVLKGGWGLFYDTLNAADYNTLNQLGYAVTTVNVPSTDFGQTWLLGDPKNGVTPIVNPFPVRTTGTRFDSPLADTLGADASDGSNFTRENPTRQHARVQRWRIGVQRELFHSTAIEVAYSGAYADRVDLAIPGVVHSRAVLQPGHQRARRLGADAAPAAGAEPVLHRQLRRTAGVEPVALCPHGRQRVLHGADHAAAEPDPRLSAAGHGRQQPAVGVRQPAARNRQDPLARGHREPSLSARLQREPGFFGEPGAREPDRGALRSRADDLAIEPGGPAVEPAGRSGLRAAVRRQPRLPENRPGLEDPGRVAAGWNDRGAAGRAAELEQRVLQRRFRRHREGQALKLPCRPTARSIQPRRGSTPRRVSRRQPTRNPHSSRSAPSRSALMVCEAPDCSSST